VIIISIGHLYPSFISSARLYTYDYSPSEEDGLGNLCPRGSFVDFWLGPISRKVKIPPIFRSMWLRVPIFIILMGFMIFRIIQTQGIVDKVGMVFVTLCILTTSIAILFGVAIAPRAWCSFCPMGTMQRSWEAANIRWR
jgi:polyferredoxin